MEIKSAIKNPANIYMIIACFYQLQGVLYDVGGYLSKSLLIVFLALSIMNFYKTITSIGRPTPLNYLTAIFVIVTLFGISDMIINGEEAVNNYKAYCLSILPIYSFYQYAQNEKINRNWIISWVPIFILLAVIFYYRDRAHYVEMFYVADEVSVINNAGYVMVALFPAITFIKEKPVIRYAFTAIILFYTISAMKRGAILIAGICLVALIASDIHAQRFSKVNIVFLSSVLCCGIYFLVIHFLETNSFFTTRLTATIEGNASGREYMYPQMFHYFLDEGSNLKIIFGHGARGVEKAFAISAHQDWLEIMIDYGLVGTIFYISYWVSSIKTLFRFKQLSFEYQSYAFFVIVYFIMSFFSMSIYNMQVFATCVCGYCLSEYYNTQNGVQSEE